MKKYIFLFLLVSSIGFGQNLNDYKYALVPAKFSFLKEENMYNLNALTKFFMEKYGFETYLTGAIAPDDFVSNNCNKVFVDLVPNNNFFTTKVKIVLKDCRGTVLYTSEEGSSREKQYKVAYNEALRMAFESFSILKSHKYQPTEKNQGMIGEPAAVKQNIEKVVDTTNDVKAIATSVDKVVLFAQPIANGFQLINSEPKVIYKILNTSTKDFYIAKKDSIQGVFFARNNEWFFEYYQNDKLVSEKVEVKF
ncbi:hypothetical protein [Flavobacterium sp.]|uniref:hypothetical protein n=1 Tax=Flavobacterium sp. TaxID=239 RepID=UPI00262AF17C|nr:hypothetical protein [Flavobacterium sp.]